MREKGKIVAHRLIWLVLLVAAVVLTVLWARGALVLELWASYVLIMYDVVSLAFFIGSLLLSYRAYEYEGNTIIVYVGWYHHYLKVNGEVADEHNTILTFTTIQLSCTLEDGTLVQAAVTLTNRISLKINNRLYKKRIKI